MSKPTTTAQPSQPIAAPPQPPAFLTLPEAAAEIKASRRFIELRIEDGEIAVLRPSKRLTRIARSEWLRWLDSYTNRRGAA
jgi:hypothetical protein